MRRRLGSFEYDAATANVVIAVAVAAAAVLGFLAFNWQGSPRMEVRATCPLWVIKRTWRPDW